MLAASSSNPDLRIWLDWKNASAQNMDAAIKCLDSLDAKFKIRGRALVETGSDAVFDATNALSQAGYVHAYYLPTDSILNCIKKCDDTGAHKLAAELQRTVERGGYSGITFDWRLNSFVKARMLDWASAHNLRMFSWDMSIDIANGRDPKTGIDKRFSELDMEALLVTFPSQFKI